MKKLIFIIIVIAISIIGYYGYDYYINEYSLEKSIEPDMASKIIVIQGEEISKEYISDNVFSEIDSGENIPDYLVKKFDFSIFNDEKEKVVSVVDKDNFLRYFVDKNEKIINGKNYSNIGIKFASENIIFPKKDFENAINIGFYKSSDLNTILYIDNFNDYFKTVVKNNGFLYEEPTDQSKKIGAVKQNDSVFIGSVSEKWSLVVNENLEIGYISNENISDKGKYISNIRKDEENFVANEKINLTWEAVYSSNPNTNKIPEMKGLNGISPTWFSLKNSSGEVSSKVSDNYIAWAKKRNYKLWPLVTNSFDLDMTHDLLHSTSARDKFINYMIDIAVEKDFDGINIDFENVYLDDKDALTHFVAEFAYQMRKNNLTSSMDVTVMDGSDNWSKCFDREQLIKYLDYLIVMAYDQYWASSPYSGPVAAHDWVDENIEKMIKVVPPEKLILGMPLYMRIWYETPSKEKANYMNTKSKPIGMGSFNNLMNEKNFDLIWSESGKHYYVGYIEDNVLKKIWVEDGNSIREKASLVNKYNLAGVATWRRGFETQDIWSIIDEAINN